MHLNHFAFTLGTVIFLIPHDIFAKIAKSLFTLSGCLLPTVAKFLELGNIKEIKQP